MTIFYLHGFNSDGGGFKYDLLKKYFPTATVLSPDLPADPKDTIKIIDEAVEKHTPPYSFFGTSLGGFYALYAGSEHKGKAFLFNPSLQPHITLDNRGIGEWKTWVKERPYHFKKEHLKALEKIRSSFWPKINQQDVYFYLGTEDKVLNHSEIPTLFPDAAKIQWFEGVKHSFGAFEKVIQSITL